MTKTRRFFVVEKMIEIDPYLQDPEFPPSTLDEEVWADCLGLVQGRHAKDLVLFHALGWARHGRAAAVWVRFDEQKKEFHCF